MILHSNDKLCVKLTKKGSVLQQLRNAGGSAVGLIAGGWCLLVCGLLLMAIFGILGAVFAVPGVILVLMGNSSKKRRARDYMPHYQQSTGFSVEELEQVDRELSSPDMIAVTFVHPNASKNHPSIGCFITPNYLVMPLIGDCYIRRIRDMVAAAYSEKIPGINGYQFGVLYISRQDTEIRKNSLFSTEESLEVVDELCKRNPSIIRDQIFIYEGKLYDLLKDGAAIVELHKRVCEEV